MNEVKEMHTVHVVCNNHCLKMCDIYIKNKWVKKKQETLPKNMIRDCITNAF